MEELKVKIVDNSEVIKSWRMVGSGDHMPWFSEKLMLSIEKALEKETESNERVDAYIVDRGREQDWTIEVESRDSDSHGIITMERTEPTKRPNISIKVLNNGCEYSIISDSVDKCFADTLALMLYTEA